MTRELYIEHVNDKTAISSKYTGGFYNVATKVASFFHGATKATTTCETKI
jgi:hypothetical protein